VFHPRGAAPVLGEFVLVKLSPCEHESQLAAPEAGLDHLQGVDAYLCASVRVAGMEVRRPVIVEVHRDHDPEEATDRRHARHVLARRGRQLSS